MAKPPTKPIPVNPRRIVLLNPTRYLGNLLLAGGLIQDFAALCKRQNREFMLVLDASFQDLCSVALADVQVLWYPRQAIRRAGPWRKLVISMDFMQRLRRFRADLAFNIEEDSLSNRMTQLSAAAYRMGCSPLRHKFGYELVLPIHYGSSHRWRGYQEVFGALGLPSTSAPNYMNLLIDQPDEVLLKKLHELGVKSGSSYIAIHPAATKDYKKWPESAFSSLCTILIDKGFIPVLLGAGHEERERCERIRISATGTTQPRPINLCDRLSLKELAAFLRVCNGIVGNDSGPSHLASAQRVPGVVVFGPSDPAIWRPLGSRTEVLRKVEQCDPRCSRRACFAEYRCLQAVQPEEVYAVLEAQIQAGASHE